MKSVAQYHFPQVVFEGGKKWLYNPILKKRFKNRPEERVRLQWVDFLLLQTDWSRNRIGFETPVQLERGDHSLRADLLLYSDEVDPKVLIECKSGAIRLSDNTAVQAARYNSLLNAPFIILTNGVEDLVYRIDDSSASSSDYPMAILPKADFLKTGYWQKRGCCSMEIQPSLKERMEWLQNMFWQHNDSTERKYLSFKESFLPFPMDHYYQIFSCGEERRMAVTLTGYGRYDNYLAVVLNQKGVNIGVCVVNLDEMAAGKSGYAVMFLQNRKYAQESKDLRELFLEGEDKDFQKTLVNTLLSLFD